MISTEKKHDMLPRILGKGKFTIPDCLKFANVSTNQVKHIPPT